MRCISGLENFAIFRAPWVQPPMSQPCDLFRHPNIFFLNYIDASSSRFAWPMFKNSVYFTDISTSIRCSRTAMSRDILVELLKRKHKEPCLTGWTVECTPINIREYFKNSLQHGFEIFFTFNIYYLGPFSQNFRSVSLFLRKLEPFCRGW